MQVLRVWLPNQGVLPWCAHGSPHTDPLAGIALSSTDRALLVTKDGKLWAIPITLPVEQLAGIKPVRLQVRVRASLCLCL